MENIIIAILSALLNISAGYLWWISSSLKRSSDLLKIQNDLIKSKDDYIRTLENGLKLRDEIMFALNDELVSRGIKRPTLRIVKNEEEVNEKI